MSTEVRRKLLRDVAILSTRRGPEPLRRPAVFLLISLLFVGISCGGSSASRARPTSAFTNAHELLFEGGVDFVADPQALEGRWREDWASELMNRVRESDLVALVRVHTIRTDTGPDQSDTYRLIAEVAEPWIGETPTGELTFTAREGDTGYATVAGKDRQILDRTFVAYVKWAADAHGGVAARWHLSPASNPVAARTKFLVERRLSSEGLGPQRTVVVHE